MFINVRQRPNTVGLLVGADARTSVPTVRGLIIACVTYYSLVLACEAGTRRGHYNGYSLLVLDYEHSFVRPHVGVWIVAAR